MNYITFKKMFDYVDRIEKARSHKYIDRRPKKTGKGWYYIYAETFKKPFRALLEIFDIKKERIDKDYEADNIQKDFGVDKNLYASHVLEFFLNREKWHNIFSKKENRQKYTKAVKQSDVEKKAKEKKEKSTEKKKTTTETTKTQKLNRSLMFRIWKRNTPEAEKLLEQDKERITDEGNSVEQIKNALKEDFKNKAIEKPQIEYSRENYDKLFPRGNIKTPIGHVKLGENQYEKLKAKSREDLLGVVAETLKNPLVIINENGSHIYAKSFVESGKTKSYQSVVIKIDGKDISISTHQRDTNNILNKIKKAEDVIYTNDSQQLPSSRNALVVGTTRETDSPQLPGTWNKPEMAGTTRETKLPHFDSQNVNPNEVSDNSEEMSSTEHGNKEAMLGNDNAKKDLTDGELAVRLNLAYLNGILEKNHIQTIENPQIGEISVEAGKTGKHGYGLKHIIEQRFKKDGKNENEIAALIMLVADAAGSGEIRNNNGNRIEIVKNGIMAIVSKERNGKKENWLLTGYDLFDEKEKATDAINEVISRYGYTPGFSGLKTQVGAVIASLEDYTSKETNVNGEHGNKTAMLGNDNAKKVFSDFVDNFIANGFKGDKPVNLLDSTPAILKEHGFSDNPISITPNIMKKILADESMIYHGHNLPVEILKDLPNQLENPVYILKGKDGKKIIATEHLIENNPVIAILELDRKEGRITVNSVRSLYDKNSNVFIEWIKNPDVVEYENKEKSKVLLQSIGLQSPKEVTTPNENIQQSETNVNEVKPQTDSEMKKEQENTKKARKEAGLPDINENALNPRVSVIDDLSWSPSSENYRYKDTGYIAGTRKENALAFLRAAGRNKTRLRETDIDWVGVEENKRAAKEVIVKSNIFGQVDWATLKENGMTGGAAFLIDRIYSQIGKEPTKDSPEARKNYVIAVNGLRDRLETAKTVQDVENILKEIKDEMNGEFFSVRNTPEYQRRLAEIKEIDRKVGEIKDKAKELADVYRDQEVRETEKILELQKQWLKEHKVIRGNQKYLYGVENKMTPELKAEYDSYCEKMQAENRKESKRLYEEWMKFREENGRTVQANNKYYFADNRYTYIDYEIEREYYDKQQELKAYERKEGVQAVLQNPLYKAWIELGDRFDVIVRSGWKSKTFYQHKADARRGMYDDWAWADKEKIEVSRTGTNRKVQFEFKVAKNYERKGGRNVSVESTEQLKKAFNLRDIQSGNWVLKDPESAKWHVDRIAEGFADLSDVTGIPDNLISLNGRLAMAIGARGKGGAGAAKAHYEAVERVINITKMKGGGSLGHEWFHAFDNMITEAMGGTEGETRSFMTNKFAYLKPKDKELMMKYLKETNLYLKARYKQELDKKNIQIPEKSTEIFQVKVANAFDNLTKVMTEGNSVIKEKITYTHADYEQAVFNIKANATTTTGRKLFEAGNIDNAMNILNGIYTDHKSKVKTKWYKLAAAFYCGNADVERGYARIDMGRRGASFLAGALDLDEGTEKYWAEPHEMAARAFSAYIDDKLRSQGRFNDYLANYTENKYYKDPILGDSFPYPEGEERKRINAAFDELFEIIKSENAIRKALLFEESAHPRGNGGQFIKKFVPDKGGVFGGNERTYNKKKFSDLTDEEKQQKKKQIRSNIVSKVKIGIIHKTEDKRASDVAYEWVDENIKGDIFTVIGNVKFNRKTVKEDLSHGFGQEKLDTLTAVKDVLEKGTYLGYERNFQGETNENHYFAGKIKYGNDEKIVFCRVKDSAGGNSCFYVHEVFTEDEIKSDLPRLGVREADSSRLVGKPLYKFILQTIFNVNDDNIIRKAIFLSKLNHEFCKLVERERRKEAYLDKLGRGYIAYLKKHHPELV